MIGEINIAGVFIPSPVIWSIIALILLFLIRRLLVRCDVYRQIWHQALFNIALFIILLGGIVFFADMLF